MGHPQCHASEVSNEAGKLRCARRHLKTAQDHFVDWWHQTQQMLLSSALLGNSPLLPLTIVRGLVSCSFNPLSTRATFPNCDCVHGFPFLTTLSIIPRWHWQLHKRDATQLVLQYPCLNTAHHLLHPSPAVKLSNLKFLETVWSSRTLGLCMLVPFPWVSFPMWLVPTQPSIFSSNTINTKFKQNLPQEVSSKSPQTVNVSVTFDFYQKTFICSHWNLYCFP